MKTAPDDIRIVHGWACHSTLGLVGCPWFQGDTSEAADPRQTSFSAGHEHSILSVQSHRRSHVSIFRRGAAQRNSSAYGVAEGRTMAL